MSIVESIVKQDPDFSEAKFRSKVENEFVQIKLSMVTGKTERIKHFVNDEIYNKIVEKVTTDRENKRIQIYDELNVYNVTIVDIRETEDYFEIEVNLRSRALDYFISSETRKYLSGNNSSRTERDNRLIFRKNKNTKLLRTVHKCPTCGASMDINESGQCRYCHSTFNLEKYDWTIVYMDI